MIGRVVTFTRSLAALVVLCLMAHAVSAGQERPAPAPAPEPGRSTQAAPRTQAPQPKPQPVPPQTLRAIPPPAPDSGGRPVNLQIELALTDQSGAGVVQKKTVSMVVADRAWGRVRAAHAPMSERLNVDARPFLVSNDAVRLELSLEYQPFRNSETEQSAPLHESLTVILQSGKPLLVSRAADPVTERRVTVEVTATIMK